MIKEGKIRCDGFPKCSLYTLTSSIENRALDKVKTLLLSSYQIITERRYVRIKHKYDIDAIFETDKHIFLAEAKFLKNRLDPSLLEKWLLQLLVVSKELNKNNIVIYLIVVSFNSSIVTELQKQIDDFSYDLENIPFEILLLNVEELT